MSTTTFHETRRIAREHPALPGHFPGQPVVPGVMLLDWVAAALGRWRGQRIAGLAQVKFLRPLLPGQDAALVLTDTGKSINFSISHEAATIASGGLEAVP
ncbi:MAG TPA: hydroxymyristoyl-ACP dehydratase [Rudaea sp.]|jgi:3-hydroxymyristoyl/3-hydroxydecanoyl-(acyl carrier protein) dehydratase